MMKFGRKKFLKYINIRFLFLKSSPRICLLIIGLSERDPHPFGVQDDLQSTELPGQGSILDFLKPLIKRLILVI